MFGSRVLEFHEMNYNCSEQLPSKDSILYSWGICTV